MIFIFWECACLWLLCLLGGSSLSFSELCTEAFRCWASTRGRGQKQGKRSLCFWAAVMHLVESVVIFIMFSITMAEGCMLKYNFVSCIVWLVIWILACTKSKHSSAGCFKGQRHLLQSLTIWVQSPGLTRWKERTASHKLSSDPRAHAVTCNCP